MDWEPLLLVIAGGVLGIFGSFITQWWSGRQADSRERRDRAHEREVWARQLRYEAHIGFLNEFERLFNAAMRAEGLGLSDQGVEPPEDFLFPLHDRLTILRTVSDQKTINAANDAIEALNGYAFGGLPDVAPLDRRDRYLVAMREEFGLTRIRIWEDDVRDEIEDRAPNEQLPGSPRPGPALDR